MSLLRPVALALALAAALAPVPVSGAAAPADSAPADTLRLTLEQAIALALSSGASMQAARAGVGIAEGRVREVLAQALPQITGTATYDRKFDSIFRGLASDTSSIAKIFGETPFGAVHSWTMELTASQLLWSGGRVGAGLKAAKAVRASVTSDRDQAAADVTLAVQEAYWNALYARRVVDIARRGLEQAREHLRQVEISRQQGARSEYDLLQAQVDAANQEPAVVSARSTAEIALLALKHTLNLPLGQPLALETPLAFADDRLPVPTESPTDASLRPAVRSAEANVQARRAAVNVEKAGRWPELTASATISHQAFPADGVPMLDEFHRSVDASIKLQWPLFQGFRTFGTVERATNELRQAMAQRDQARQSAEMDLAQARLGLDESLSTLAARRGTARLAERAWQLADVRWKNGLGTQLEVSDARLQMQNAEVNEVLALKDYRLALARLVRAAGRPVPTTSKSFDDLSFDPTSHEER